MLAASQQTLLELVQQLLPNETGLLTADKEERKNCRAVKPECTCKIYDEKELRGGGESTYCSKSATFLQLFLKPEACPIAFLSSTLSSRQLCSSQHSPPPHFLFPFITYQCTIITQLLLYRHFVLKNTAPLHAEVLGGFPTRGGR